MMRPVRLYDELVQFAEMMMRHLSESMDVTVRQKEEEPLLLEISLKPNNPEEKVQVSLHNTFRTYMAGGDLNAAVDYLNSIIRCSQLVRTKSDVAKLDPAYIFPAIRDERYVKEAAENSPFLSEEYLPGLRVIYIEIKDSCSKIVNEAILSHNPRLTVERVKRLAYRNLRSAGWQPSRLSLQSPFHKSCYVEVFMDNSHPVECQFLLPDMASRNLPRNCVIAYTNRKNALMMRSEERMETIAQALRLVEKSRFRDVVKRSCNLLPSPVSERIYWISNGEARLLEQV
ncbi:DUF1444 family protein [Cohnella silvisoli]|uniref:DUF1444 family protein n=1 Tax=Cohnella silvisoli TaxID=2873699 RepID=A0ABV1KP81_9BACL|nr:DUF1444 family protein [Cohnella silvisoli]MCD9020241.1 DUF1444 family protein [Cohnella silvisoli]